MKLLFLFAFVICSLFSNAQAKARINYLLVSPDTTGFYLNGSQSKPATGGRITIFTWFKISGPACTIVNPNVSRTLVSGLKVGTYFFRLQVVSSNGKVANDTLKLTVR